MFFAILFRWCFYLINDKNLFRSTWSVTFAKIFSYFNILTISTIFNLEYFSLFSLLESIYVHDYILTGLILIMLWYVLLYLLHYHLIYQYTQLLFFKVLINLSAITYFSLTDFPSLCVGHSFISLFCKTDFIDQLQNSLPLSIHLLFGFRIDSFKIVWKALVIVALF